MYSTPTAPRRRVAPGRPGRLQRKVLPCSPLPRRLAAPDVFLHQVGLGYLEPPKVTDFRVAAEYWRSAAGAGWAGGGAGANSGLVCSSACSLAQFLSVTSTLVGVNPSAVRIGLLPETDATGPWVSEPRQSRGRRSRRSRSASRRRGPPRHFPGEESLLRTADAASAAPSAPLRESANGSAVPAPTPHSQVSVPAIMPAAAAVARPKYSGLQNNEPDRPLGSVGSAPKEDLDKQARCALDAFARFARGPGGARNAHLLRPGSVDCRAERWR